MPGEGTRDAGEGSGRTPRPHPTVIQPPRRTEPAAMERPAGRTPAPARPTAIAGTEPPRVPVAVDDLKRLSPEASDATLAAALQLVRSYVLSDEDERASVLWGQRPQQEYADLVSETLSLAQADPLRRATAHLDRMMRILGAIDVEAVAEAMARGGVGRYLRRMTERIDTPEELSAARRELDQLVTLLRQETDDLLGLKEKLERASARIDEVGQRVEAAALAAQYLASRLESERPGLAQRFLGRSASLTQTALQIRGGASLRAGQVAEPLRLIGVVQDVVLVMVPAWLGAVAAVTALAGARRPTPTEAGELAYQLRKILERMQA